MWLTGAPPYGVVTPRWNPETVRAGLGGDTYLSSLPFRQSARMYFISLGTTHMPSPFPSTVGLYCASLPFLPLLP